MSKKPLCVAFLWHMHQPDYGNIQTGEIYLPWTRFHAVKDYYDMGALVEQASGLHLTINVVPSLLDQLVLYGDGKACETYEALSLKNAGELEEREKAFLLRSFFQLPKKRMALPYPRYKQLLEKRGPANERGDFPEGLKHYSTRDYRDLQVWYNLTWCGNELRCDPEVAALMEKSKDFTEDDKKKLLGIQQAFIGRILPLYRHLLEEHGIELSVSPYHHPILPLLCDNRSAREALPTISLPANPFSFPADAREQIRRAHERSEELFGRKPQGMWPSEGSLSDAALLLAREAGLRWLASDEGVLLKSLQREKRVGDRLTPQQKFCAYQWGEGKDGPCLFFRDHGLSDLIGFTYSSWRAEDAVADFTNRLSQIHRSLPDDGRHYVVSVILDGENAWEHYPNNGIEFLKLLYRRLTESPRLRTVTFSEFLGLERCREPLKSLVSGSWIYGNLATWIGHPEKNRGWDLLTAARSFLSACQQRCTDRERLENSYREMLIAEGSDWFWWYGDEHQTENAAELDALFRNHVKNVYRLLGESYPLDLDTPIKKASAKIQLRAPVHTISPRLDGKVSDYFEWLSAGFATPASGSMHRTERYLEKVYFGYDTRQFYVRIDLVRGQRGAYSSGGSIQLCFVTPKDLQLTCELDQGGKWRCRVLKSPVPDVRPGFAGGRILEFGIPLDILGIQRPGEIQFFVAAYENERELDRFPASGFLVVPVDPWGLNEREWIV